MTADIESTLVSTQMDGFRQDNELWWGWTAEDGWLVLDRTDRRNREAGRRHLFRCRDWQKLIVTKTDFSSVRFRWFVNYVEGMAEEAQQRECLAELFQFRTAFLSRRADLQGVTEEDWIKGPVPMMIGHAITLPSAERSGFWTGGQRRHLLLACAIARLYWPALKRSRKLVEKLEAGIEEAPKRRTNRIAVEPADLEERLLADVRSAPAALYQAGMKDMAHLFLGGWGDLTHPDRAVQEDEAAYNGWAERIHDVFGNPFRPVQLNPTWLTPAIVTLAEAVYNERLIPAGTLDAARLAALANALDEAGCTEPAILAHLRSSASHVRGCWVVDRLIGKS